MKFSLLLATCGFAALVLALDGCVSAPSQQMRSVSQKQLPSQTPSYPPAYPPYSGNAQISVAPRPPVPYTPVAPAAPVAAAKVKVALLLPLSGKNAALGQAMFNAAQQAVFDAAGANFELQPHDTAAEGGAEAAARSAVSGGAQLIIGPLFATDVPITEAIVQSSGLQLLTLSTDTSLASRGVYVMGLAPGAQVERVVSFAVAQGAHHFAALVPSSPYGALVGGVFQNAVAHNGGVVVDYESCDPAGHECEDRVKRLAQQRDGIDALFLPESGAELKTIADQLMAAGFTPERTHALGTGLWDVAGLGKQSALLNGGWYAAPDPAARRAFISSYSAAYGQEPPRLATLAYDATALAAVLAKRGARYDEAALTNPNGFAGLDGIFRLIPGGTVERGLAVNAVTTEGARVIDAAPTSFIGRNAY
jgi:ABC-type branched-subunit amino acid transport system substrate-binding protein